MLIERRKLLAALGMQPALVGSGVSLEPMFMETSACAQTLSGTPIEIPTGTRQWYVDNKLIADGDGITWETAWNALAKIDWDSIAPGDTIHISGGASGQRYNETLTIGASGRPNAQITITAGIDAGHAGSVTIDAQGLRSQCIVVGSHNYLTIQNLTIQNTANDANLTVNGATAGVLIQRIVSIREWGPAAATTVAVSTSAIAW